MLSRVADALYWMGRYLERAENVARLLVVASELSVELEGLDETLAQTEWDELLAAMPGAEPRDFSFSPETGLALPYINWLLLDESNTFSVRYSLGRARDNARSVREALTREIFSHLNEGYRALDALNRRKIRDSVVGHDSVTQTHRDILTMLGAIEHTLTRDQGWTFMKLGEALERTQRTLLVLRARLPSLGVLATEMDLPLFYARWRGLLRAVASLENYRRMHGAGLDPERVIRFLLFDPSAPRAALCGLTRIQNYLDQLPGGSDLSAADRIIGKLRATFTYDVEQIMEKPDLVDFCADAVTRLAAAHEAIARQYFPA